VLLSGSKQFPAPYNYYKVLETVSSHLKAPKLIKVMYKLYQEKRNEQTNYPHTPEEGVQALFKVTGNLALHVHDFPAR